MTPSSEDSASLPKHLPVYDYAAVFEKTPGLYLILDPSFTIVAANDAFCGATRRARDAIVGRPLFEAFPDDPADASASGVESLRASLLRVLKTRKPDRMAVQRHDMRPEAGTAYEERHWSQVNIPVMGPDGYVKWIIHSVEDVTGIAYLRAEFAANRGLNAAQYLLARLNQTERDLDTERGENVVLRESLRARG
jgi:PAS domain-containing protein